MKVPVRWLQSLVEVDADLEALSDRLTFAGLEVEAIETIGDTFDGVVAGKVTEILSHPNAEKLQLCTVDYGTAEPMRVVCGAPNVAVGGVYPFAPVGTTLPGGFTLKKAKIRGEVSMGMLCAKDELGLGEDHSGLLELDTAIEAGTPFVEIWGAPETVIELEITPNRPDCLSMVGVARELAVLSDQSVRLPSTTVETSGTGELSVQIENAEVVPRYSVRIIEGIQVTASPAWMQERLEAAGIRPINNVVDVTNYVMLETGHPLHAFDRDALSGNQIEVRAAQSGECFISLDGVERTLEEDMWVISDAQKAVAIAGVMGGKNSEVTEVTKTVVLEAACFDPTTIRSTAKRLGLHSDSSYRFQRGVCAHSVREASDRAAALLIEIAAAGKVSEVVDSYPSPTPTKEVKVEWRRIAQRIGASISVDEMRSILEKLSIEVREDDGVSAIAIPPFFRLDIEREIDVVEEVARIYGMDRIEAALPVAKRVEGSSDIRVDAVVVLRHALAGLGVSEIMNYTLVSDALLNRFDDQNQATRETLQHPISEDQSVLRPSLIPQLVESLGRNHARQIEEACFYEIGRVFNREQATLVQEERLAIGFMGPIGRAPLNKRAEVSEEEQFVWIKGVVEQLLEKQGVKEVRFEAIDEAPFERGQALAILQKEKVIGRLGLVRARAREAWRLQGPIGIAELSLEALLGSVGQIDPVSPVPVYPSISRDVALVVDAGITHAAVLNVIEQAKPKDLEQVHLFDVYTGKGMEKGKKSLAYNFIYRSASKTLTDKKVNKAHERVMQLLCSELPAEIRK
jgi:phenylalanyl-tRNA synthetase beta chain